MRHVPAFSPWPGGDFGLRWQSAAATPLSIARELNEPKHHLSARKPVNFTTNSAPSS